MNTMQQGVITLLKSAVLQRAFPLPPDFDLEEAYPQLKRHHMDAMLFEGAVLCGIPQEMPVMQKLLRSSCKALLTSERQVHTAKRICEAFDENGIDYMLLKGCKMKQLYPKPELRAMGDIDILIRFEQYNRIIPIMENMEFTPVAESDYDMQWRKSSAFLELHKRLISERNKDFFSYFGDGWKLAINQEGTRYVMSPEDEMVYLFTHFAKHYRDGGIGCRHVVDLWVFQRSHPALNEEKVKAELNKLHLLQFYENILRVLAVWFNDAQSNEMTDFITDYVFESGSWGKKETHIVSLGVWDGSSERGGHGARWKYLLRIVFPGVEALKNKYTILKKAPWFLPIVWIIRPFYKLLSKKEHESFHTHRKNLRVLSPEKITSRQQALAYVGLKYNF